MRALEDVRQTTLIQQARADSGKVYGYQMVHDDLRDDGETCSENRVVRLASLAGFAAQIGYKCRPGRYRGKPAVVADNTLNGQFQVIFLLNEHMPCRAMDEPLTGDDEIIDSRMNGQVSRTLGAPHSS